MRSPSEKRPLHIFCAYAQADIQTADRLIEFLAVLPKTSEVVLSHVATVGFPSDLQAALEAEIDRADLVLLFSSVDFWKDELWKQLTQRVLERRSVGTEVALVALRAVVPPPEVERLARLPRRGRPIETRRKPELAMEQVAKELQAWVKRRTTTGSPLPLERGFHQDGLEWARRWLLWGGGGTFVLGGLGALALLLRFLLGSTLPSAKGPAEIRLLGRSTEHPAVVHQLCAALNALAPDHVSCTLSLQLPKLPPEPTTVLSVRVESGGLQLTPGPAVPVRFGQIPIPRTVGEVQTVAQIMVEFAKFLQGKPRDALQAQKLSRSVSDAEEPPELLVLRLYVRALRGLPELSTEERNQLRALCQSCLQEESRAWWCRLAMLTYVRHCASAGCDDVPKAVEALLSGPDLGHTERWIAQAARARYLCSARKAEEAAQELLRIQQEMADQREACLELVLVDALGCVLTTLQERAGHTTLPEETLSRIRALEGVALGILPCGGTSIGGALAQRAGWRAARGEFDRALADFAELHRVQPDLHLDDRDRLLESKCHLLVGDSQRVSDLLRRWLADHTRTPVAGGQATKVRAAFYLWLADTTPNSSPSKQERAKDLLAFFAQLDQGPAIADQDAPFRLWACKDKRSAACLAFEVLASAGSADWGTQERLRKALAVSSPR